ncbi:HAD family hydrolase [Corynebacterium sp. 35RC1]|nr:HAD family hydrolase [Corynebacterium sp. 35RC1]
MSAPSPAAILFDLDDTLIDSAHAAHAGAIAWHQEIGAPGTPNPERWRSIEIAWYKRFERGETTYLGQRIGRVREYLNAPDLPEEEALELLQRFYPHYLAATTAFPDAPSALERARHTGATVGIFTNGGFEMQFSKMEHAGIAHPWLKVFAAVELGHPKPQPQAYTKVAQLLGTSNITMVGDNLENDVLAPLQAGWQAVYLQRPGAPPAPAGVVGVGTLDELF